MGEVGSSSCTIPYRVVDAWPGDGGDAGRVGSVTYLLRCGPGGLRRKAHLAKYNAHGQIVGTWCGRPYNLTSNVPWGCATCKDCKRRGGYQ